MRTTTAVAVAVCGVPWNRPRGDDNGVSLGPYPRWALVAQLVDGGWVSYSRAKQPLRGGGGGRPSTLREGPAARGPLVAVLAVRGSTAQRSGC